MDAAGRTCVRRLILPIEGGIERFPDYNSGRNRDYTVTNQDTEGREEFSSHRNRRNVSVAEGRDCNHGPVDADRNILKSTLRSSRFKDVSYCSHDDGKNDHGKKENRDLGPAGHQATQNDIRAPDVLEHLQDSEHA